MSYKSKMKSLISQTLSTFSPHFLKPSHLPFYFQVPKSILCSLQHPELIGLKSSLPSIKSPVYSTYTQSANFRLDASEGSSGEIHVIVGPMFAGKTSTILRRIQDESSYGRSVAIIKSNKDTRYGLDSIVTHDGKRMPCWAVADLSSFREVFGLDAYDKLEVIGIDEAQFFDDLYDFCRTAADHDGKTIIVGGLDGDYLRRSFGSVLDIIPLANSVTKLTARCEICGKRAFFTLRKSEETQKELIGGADVYMPVCRQHYVNGQVVIEATRDVLETRRIHCSSY